MLGLKLDRLLWRIPQKVPAHQQTRQVETAHARLRIRDTGGDAPALVFLCDPPITVEAYDEVIAKFQANFRVLVIELPSFGFSKVKSASALSFEGAVLAVEEVLASLGLPSLILFGPCICGFVATELAARKRLPLRGLVLMQVPDSEGMYGWVDRMDPKGLLRLPLIGQLLIRFTARRTSKFWLKYATAKNFDASPLVNASDQVLHQGGGYPLASMLQYWQAGIKNANLPVPALAIWGKQDRSHAKTDSNCTRKHVANAEVLEFDGCGHFTELENPQEFCQRVSPFIKACFSEVVTE